MGRIKAGHRSLCGRSGRGGLCTGRPPSVFRLAALPCRHLPQQGGRIFMLIRTLVAASHLAPSVALGTIRFPPPSLGEVPEGRRGRDPVQREKNRGLRSVGSASKKHSPRFRLAEARNLSDLPRFSRAAIWRLVATGSRIGVLGTVRRPPPRGVGGWERWWPPYGGEMDPAADARKGPMGGSPPRRTAPVEGSPPCRPGCLARIESDVRTLTARLGLGQSGG